LYKRLHHNEAINSMYNNISFLYFSKQDYKMADVYIDSAIANSKIQEF
jgi:hypothetical protein